jgi:DNA replication and repair protein RecF
MYITELQLQHFRNHVETNVEWAPHLNVIIGPNGAGKTSLIDAIHYLCMSRSFVSSSDMYVVNQDSKYFMLTGSFKGQIRSEFEVSCNYAKGDGKKIFINGSPLERLSDLIGMVPVVVLCPEDQKLTADGPKERRSFIDSFISQISKKYLKDLIDYKRIVKQRNALLQDFRGPESQLLAYLEPWDEQLVEVGSRIIATRTAVLNKFQGYMEQQYDSIAGIKHRPHMEYQTICEPSEDPAAIAAEYREALAKAQQRELDREQTVIGPHRDEIVFYLDDFEIRKYGSQGQHRLFALALKLAQLFYFSDELDDLPIFLLDDVFGDLDAHKIEVLLKALADHPGQTFITSAHPVAFDDHVNFDGENNRIFQVEQGEVTMATHLI